MTPSAWLLVAVVVRGFPPEMPTRAITKAHHAEAMKAVFAACAKADPAQASALSQQLSQIEQAVAYLKQTCF